MEVPKEGSLTAETKGWIPSVPIAYLALLKRTTSRLGPKCVEVPLLAHQLQVNVILCPAVGAHQIGILPPV